MTTAKFFTYKGHLAAEIDMDGGKFINDPKAKGQLGCVISTTEVGMTTEAKAMIKKAKRDSGSFSELMLTAHHPSIHETSGKSSIGILGGSKVYYGLPGSFSIGRTCTISVVDDCETIEMEAPADYKKFIDGLDRK